MSELKPRERPDFNVWAFFLCGIVFSDSQLIHWPQLLHEALIRIRLVATIIPAIAFSVVIAAAQDSRDHLAQLQKDHEDLQSYTLTMDVVTRTFAAHHETDDVIKADPALGASMNKARGKGDFATIDQLSAALAVSPRLIAIGNAHALTPRALDLAITSAIQKQKFNGRG